MPNFGDGKAHIFAEEGNLGQKMPAPQAQLRFFRLCPLSHQMKMEQPQLLVRLEDKMRRVARHWAVVDDKLPPEYPLLLLSGVVREGFDELLASLPGLRDRVGATEVNLKIVRGNYERLKRELHGWVGWFNGCLRQWHGSGLACMVRRLPGLGRSFRHWWKAALHVSTVWELAEKNPPDASWCWPIEYPRGGTLPDFAKLGRAFDTAYRSINKAEVDLKVARGNLQVAQQQATALLMAYGHGVRARLGQSGELVRSIPKLWPKHGSKVKPGRKRVSP